MDISDLMKCIFLRIQQIEPDNAVKVLGCIILTDSAEQEMIQLAFSPVPVLLAKIAQAKARLGLQPPQPYGWDPNLSNFDDEESSSYSGSRRPEFPAVKACHYFYKGYCKHGANCRYFHGSVDENDNEMNEHHRHHGFVGSLEKLELEIAELLRSRRGTPVTVASLPTLYFAKYGKYLQADGYLTESQRHGKAGLSLTKLLARLKNSIRLIDKPHGQHDVILAEDAAKYVDYRDEIGASSASSHQIYLTFPAESIFTEEDVCNYFNQFGPVRDVRIPSQEKRMFGFVSFVYPQTVSSILMKRNPHYICGARVLVKPYREKSRMIERRDYMERMKASMIYPSCHLEMDPELHSMPREVESCQFLNKNMLEEQEKMLELERRYSSGLNLVQIPTNQHTFGWKGFELSKGLDQFPSDNHFSYMLDALNSGSASDDPARQTCDGYNDQQNTQVDLPESPFASPKVQQLCRDPKKQMDD